MINFNLAKTSVAFSMHHFCLIIHIQCEMRHIRTATAIKKKVLITIVWNSIEIMCHWNWYARRRYDYSHRANCHLSDQSRTTVIWASARTFTARVYVSACAHDECRCKTCHSALPIRKFILWNLEDNRSVAEEKPSPLGLLSQGFTLCHCLLINFIDSNLTAAF